MALLPIVDEQDNVISYKERSDIKTEDVYRVSGLWITNSKGELLLAKRSLLKAHNPGKWGPSVAGTVEKGESYYENIIKEAQEELGITGISPIADAKSRVTGKHNFFSQQYTLVLDISIEDLRLQEEEVMDARWFAIQELKSALQEHPDAFVQSVHKWIMLKYP
jgi:isopentenyldiphosphate isomerase